MGERLYNSEDLKQWLGARAAPKSLRFAEVHVKLGIVVQTIRRDIVLASQELQQQDKQTYEGAWFNSSNQRAYDPFRVVPDSCRRRMQVDSKWWSSQTEAFRREIEAYVVEATDAPIEVADDFDYPHEYTNHLWCQHIYQIYCAQFSYENFVHCIFPKPTIVLLNRLDTRTLLEKSRVCCLTGRSLQKHDFEDFSAEFLQTIDEYCRVHQETGIFAKTHQKSAKNDITLRPLHSAADVLRQLALSRDVLETMEQSSGTLEEIPLVLIPWQARISKENEWRVFVQDGHVRALSQQQWCTALGLTVEDAHEVAESVVVWYKDEVQNNLSWSDMVLDVWVDEQQCHLIEVNPGGRWASSGSSLFEWRADMDILHRPIDSKDASVYVRILQ